MKKLTGLGCLLAAMSLMACGSSPPPEPVPPPAPQPVAQTATHAAAAPPVQSDALTRWGEGAILFDDLGGFSRKVTTSSPEAQKYFDQGMRLLYAFNHDESTRSFVKAGQIDPGCGMCWWGASLALGPNYNMPMMPDRAQAAWQARNLALQNASKGTPVEQGLIGALAKRYKGPEPLDPPQMQPFLEAYAAAMQDVAKRFPGDLDVQTMYAESKMMLHPWKLWGADGKPAPGTEEIVATLEAVLAKDPNHPGANHYYIHAVEASPHPEKAVPSAERVANMMKGAGHLVHMPAHVYQRVGRYDDAVEANRQAIVADKSYMGKIRPLGYYGMYTAHNRLFLAYSAAMEGRRSETLDAARNAGESLPPEVLGMMPGLDWYLSPKYTALVRFGMWDEMLNTPAPEAKYTLLTGMWLYAHAVANGEKKKTADAEGDVAKLRKLIDGLPADIQAGTNDAKLVMAVALRMSEASVAKARGNAAEEIRLLTEAVAKEDTLAYDEPADWFFPARHVLGAALLKNGKAAQAEVVYREDLRRNPKNGWALFGLSQALRAQKKTKEATETQQAFQKAWQRADTKPTSSAF
ncbi:hypothetical protein LVJ94_50795 [Pendulispora rubella]|uniref:Tetratricopeptide repeat protein n=1 Tax=Pendulispora rubella TaxID=2741070 RepID=A0ABZ2L5E0_9BACT